MDTKLTLKLKDDSISRAKKYVSSIGTSLSAIVEDFFDEDLKHGSSDIKVCDNAVFKRSYGNDGTGGTADNVFCFLADITDGVGTGVNSNNGRLAHDDAFAFGENKGVCGTKVDTDILIEEIESEIEFHYKKLSFRAV